jgi:hypothetical protein
MRKQALLVIGAILCLSWRQAAAHSEPTAPGPHYDGALAKSLGADERGMRAYVLVILKTGPNKVPDGPTRKKMFEGHFANMQRLAAEKKLVLAWPLDGSDGRRGIFVFATPDIAQARTYVATVIVNGEMAAEYHQFYGSAGLMMMNEIHDKIRQK